MLGVALICLLTTVFDAGVQTALVRRYLAPQVQHLTVERVRLLPWSFSIHGLDLAHGGARVLLPRAELGIAPWRLLFDQLVLSRVDVPNFYVDLRALEPDDAPPAPFPGVFALLDQGLALVLDDVLAFGEVRLAGARRVDLTVRGGGVAPDATGALEITANLHQDADGARYELAGPLALRQDADGRARALSLDVIGLAALPASAREELLALDLRLTPFEEPAPDPDAATTGTPRLRGDRIEVIVTRPGATGDLATLTVHGRLHADAQAVEGEFDFTTHDGVIADYLPDLPLPIFEEDAHGHFGIELSGGRVVLDYRGGMRVDGLERLLGDNPNLPRELHWDKTFSALFDGTTIELYGLRAALADDAGQTLLDVALSAPLQVSLADPDAVLQPKRALATLALGALPLRWLNGLLPSALLEAGDLEGAFELRAGDGSVSLTPTAALRAAAVRFAQDLALPEDLTVSGQPTLRLQDGQLRLDLRGLALQLGTRELAQIDIDARYDLNASTAPPARLRLAGQLDLDGILALPPVAVHLADQRLPEALSARIAADLSVDAQRLACRSLEFELGQGTRTAILDARTVAPFTLAFGAQTPRWRLAGGELAKLAVHGFDLSWLNPYLPDLSLAGTIVGAAFGFAAEADGALAVRAEAPLRLQRLAVQAGADTLIEDAALAVMLDVDYAPQRVDLRYRGLDLRVGGAPLLAGRGAAGWPLATPAQVHAEGTLELTLAALARVPALGPAVAALAPSRQWALDLDFAVDSQPDRIDIPRLAATLAVDGRRHVDLRSSGPLILRPRLAADEDLARHLTGTLALAVTDLSAAIVGDLVPLGGFDFATLAGAATLSSDGRTLEIDAGEGLRLGGASLAGEQAVLVERFDLALAARGLVRGRHAELALDTLDLTFAARPDTPALAGRLAFTVEPDQAIPLRELDAALTGHVPALLDQPLLMPGHGLDAGRVAVTAAVTPSGAISVGAQLDGLAAGSALAIDDIDGTANGQMAPDGRGFSLTMEVVGNGRSGQSDGLLAARFDPASAAGTGLGLDFQSERFFLNDVLATLASIRGAPTPPPAAARTDDAPAQRPDMRADEQAFWDVLPYRAHLDYRIRDLYYTDYLVFNDVAGGVDIESARLGLTALTARFHDSPLRFDGTLAFAAGDAAPYALEFAGDVTDFDLNQFFTELVPGDKPRVEGLFGIDVSGAGRAPNMAQFRNELLFDMQLTSRDGLFRTFPPGSGLLVGASDALGLLGEGLSYVPTSGFGAGTLSRLVNYIAVIDYDHIDIHVVRDATRDLAIRRFRVQSPTISLKAEGGIEYREGLDILDSPLALDASLDMSGRGAAILYSMNLLREGVDAQGYHKGPAFRVRGTLAKAESNLEEILTAAADGTVKGGFTRPIAGLIGNIRYRWFGSEPQPVVEESAPGVGGSAAESQSE